LTSATQGSEYCPVSYTILAEGAERRRSRRVALFDSEYQIQPELAQLDVLGGEVRSRYASVRAAVFYSGLFFLLALGHAIAQGTASITGTVVDTSQAAVPGSQVTLTNTETAQATVKTSSDQGFFEFPDLPPANTG
jgi:hypothetical protein